jgi:hypothetical protein
MAQKSGTSPYYFTPVRDFYLDIWSPRLFSPTIDDQVYQIPAKFHQRPDLAAAQVFGTPRLWWAFAVRNPDVLIDPIGNFESGVEIFLPSSDQISSIRQ